jgi:hypothetical protein
VSSCAEVQEFDIYQSELARRQVEYDAVDYRRSLYTNTKADHEADRLTGEPCGCERGDDTSWEPYGFRSGGHFVPGALQPEFDPCGSAMPTRDLEAGS